MNLDGFEETQIILSCYLKKIIVANICQSTCLERVFISRWWENKKNGEFGKLGSIVFEKFGLV